MGVVYASAAGSWILAAFESQGSHGLEALLGALLAALWAKGLVFGTIGWVTQQLRARAVAIGVIVPAVLLGLAEFFISQSRLGFPLLLLGHSQASVPGVAQLAVAIGVPGISALLFAVNAAFASLLIDRRSAGRLATALAAAWLAAAGGGLPLARFFQSHSPQVGTESKFLLLVQPSISRNLRWDPAAQGRVLDEMAAYTSRAIRDTPDAPDAILWPENLLTSPLAENSRLERRLQAYVNRWRIPVVTGLVRESITGVAAEYRSSALWWSPLVGQQGAIDKLRAIPLIESKRGFWGRSLLASMVGQAAEGPKVAEALSAGPLRGEFTLSAVLCFEILFPRLVADRRDESSVAIVNLADDSWVEGEALDTQLISAAAFRAIEQRLTLLRVSHGGLSVAIDSLGQQIVSLPPDRFAHALVEVSSASPPSIVEKVSILLLPATAGSIAWFLCSWVAGRTHSRLGSQMTSGRSSSRDAKSRARSRN
jgi:apolipoprotein N-acyltransferase